MYERERKGIQIPNAYLCEINFNTCIIFTSQSLKIMLQNNFKDSEISCTYIGDDPKPEIEFWFYKTVYIYFKYIIRLLIYLFIYWLCVCVHLSACIHVWRCTYATETWKSWFSPPTMWVSRMELKSSLVTDQAPLFINPPHQCSTCSCK